MAGRRLLTILAAAVLTVAAQETGLLGDWGKARRVDAARASWAPSVDGLSSSVALASNLNSPYVLGLMKATGRVVRYDAATGGWTDIGTPLNAAGFPSTPFQLAVSDDDAYAATADGVFHWLPSTGWRSVAEPVVEIFASRDGIRGSHPDQPKNLQPFLYLITAAGEVVRLAGQERRSLGFNVARSTLTESVDGAGVVSLFKLDAGRGAVWRYYPGGTWGAIGGPAQQLVGGETALFGGVQLLATDPRTGQPKVYKGPAGWVSPAFGAGTSRPRIAHGGRFAWGNSSGWSTPLYYLPPDSASLWVSGPFTTPFVAPNPGVVAPWVQMRGGTTSAFAIHDRAARRELLSVSPEGRVHHFEEWAFERVEPSPPSTLRGRVGDPLDASVTEFWDWVGDIAVFLISGDLPPGVTMEMTPSGSIRFFGTPTEHGSSHVYLLLVDSIGTNQLIDIDIEITWPYLPAPAPPRASVPINPASGLGLVNCHPLGHPLTAWIRDATARTPWQRVSSGPLAWQGVLDPDTGTVSCAAAAPVDIPIPDGHLVEVAVVDAAMDTCGGLDEPWIAGCEYRHWWLTGAPAAPPVTAQL